MLQDYADIGCRWPRDLLTLPFDFDGTETPPPTATDWAMASPFAFFERAADGHVFGYTPESGADAFRITTPGEVFKDRPDRPMTLILKFKEYPPETVTEPRQTPAERERADRIAVAQNKWADGVPLAGTLGEHYLVAIRGIPVPAAGWPHDAMRWHVQDRAVMFAATSDEGEAQAVHLVYLTAAGRNVIVNKGGKTRKRKLTFGPLNHPTAMVRFPAADGLGLAAALQRAEGPETGLTGWSATGRETWVLLGPLPRSDPPRGRPIVDLCDDDAVGSPAYRRYQTALADWRDAGININPAIPWETSRQDKSDFNDVLREAGLDEVRGRLRLAELAGHGLAPVPPPFRIPTASREDIADTLKEAITRFFARRWDDKPPRLLLSGAPGTGKTTLISQRLPRQVIFDRDVKQRPWRYIVMAPNHDLSEQIAARIRQSIAEENTLTGPVTVEVFRGRGDPFDEAGQIAGKYPCKNLAEVKLAILATADVNRAVCGTAKTKTQCQFRAGCAYFAQIERCAKADIVVMSHNFLFEPMPGHLYPMLDNVCAVIVEEDFTGHGVGTVELKPSVFGDDQLDRYPVLGKRRDRKSGEGNKVRDNALTIELSVLYGKISDAKDLIDASEPCLTALRIARLTEQNLDDAITLSWKRRVDDEMYPGMPLADRKERAELGSLHDLFKTAR